MIVLLLGDTGKLGVAIKTELSHYKIIGASSKDFDAKKPNSINSLLESVKPNVVINTVAQTGIDECEKKPLDALKINAKFPLHLAKLSLKFDFTLVHISTESVYSDINCGLLYEDSIPAPKNTYGMSKHLGDQFVESICQKYFIVRLPMLFGKSKKNDQLVERMVKKVQRGTKKIRIAKDIITTPTYTRDVAKAIEQIIEEYSYGVYHVANSGKTSLCDFFVELEKLLGFDFDVYPALSTEFVSIGEKNLNTPLASKFMSLRSWQLALKDYCDNVY